MHGSLEVRAPRSPKGAASNMFESASGSRVLAVLKPYCHVPKAGSPNILADASDFNVAECSDFFALWVVKLNLKANGLPFAASQVSAIRVRPPCTPCRHQKPEGLNKN